MAGPRRLISNFRSQRLRAPATPRNNPQRQAAEAAKRDRWRRQQQPAVAGESSVPQVASGQRTQARSSRHGLWRHRRDPFHPWWEHLPAEQRRLRRRIALQLRRLRAWLGQKRQRIAIGLIVYLVLCSLPLAWGLPLLGLVALLPLLLVPPVGWLVYRLVWHDFHH